MSIRPRHAILIAAFALLPFTRAAQATDTQAAAQPAKAPVAEPVPSTQAKGVTKTRTKSNNSNDLAAPLPGEPAEKRGDVKIKTKSNIKND